MRRIIAFQSRISRTKVNLANYAAVVFEKVTLNDGNAYDARTGKFTAPEDGVYSFTWTILTKAGKKFNTEIVHNGNINGYNHADGVSGSSSYSSGSSSAIIKMKKKDEVWIRTHGGDGQHAYDDWSSFSGLKLTTLFKTALLVVCMIFVVYAKERPQDKYNTVCQGMGYITTNCTAGEKGIIAFQSRISRTKVNLANYAAVVFEKVTLNDGNAYDARTGKFTAPEDGVYSFTWTILTKAGKKFNTEIVSNSNIIG
ncbi:uncharacterized protein LOC134263475 [Saccostrea cucullata]|uniref:uncharacterized protein LOC134263475 n=1 Tax=Saccostrea cuccullata TaxID=36930 RepID=UPI002ED0D070